MATFTISHTRDLDKRLPREPTHRRPAGQLVSPLTYTNDIVNFDHWDQMFIKNCCKRWTLHNFDGPPATILDLGCGRGLWAIEAARQWQGSVVVGFDAQREQPKLSLIDKTLSRRVKWVHGNLYRAPLDLLDPSFSFDLTSLDGLPFLNGQFNFVRMVRMGLHIPEDEWGYVLSEISRVLSPNGVFEIIEEDLIFPCPTLPRSGATSGSDHSSESSSPRSSDTTISNSTLVTKLDFSGTGTSSKSAKLDMLSGSSWSSLSLATNSTELSCSPPDPRDHSRLRRAWEEMLNDSFLAPNLISILPFHLGAWFCDIQAHPPLEIPLPPSPSRKRTAQPTTGPPDIIDPDTLFELRPLSSLFPDLNDDSTRSPKRESSHRAVSSWAPMHLARTLRTITACKESIWFAYEKLYCQDPIPSFVRSSQEKYLKEHFAEAQSTTNPLRDYFDHDWINWENDMADRTSVRGSMQSELCWNEPFGKPPEWRAWFNSLPSNDETDYEEKPELCRKLRGFVCFKPDTASTNA